MQIYERAAGTHDQPRLAAVECLGGPPVITLPTLIGYITPQIQPDLEKQLVDKPDIIVSPPNLALVNFPVIAATTLPPEALHITEPFDADIQITPVPTWNFGDPTSPDNTTTGPVGLPYDGVSALDNPAHYPLTHTYRKPGDYTVTLTVTWTAVSVTTADHPDPIALPDPHPTATTVTLANVDVHEAHAVLISGG